MISRDLAGNLDHDIPFENAQDHVSKSATSLKCVAVMGMHVSRHSALADPTLLIDTHVVDRSNLSDSAQTTFACCLV